MDQIFQNAPAALAHISGGAESSVGGTVAFYPRETGTLVVANIYGLPFEAERSCASRIFGFHIHEGGACTPPAFEDAGGHFNPEGCEHPQHAGDLPPLFGCRGEAYLAMLTDRFSVSDVVGRTVVIHDAPDDFTTQPAGHAGARIGCGVIRSL